MSNHYLHAPPRLAFVPRLPQLWLHVTRQDGDADALALQDTFEPPGHVGGASVNRKHMYLAPTAQAGLDVLHQPPLLRVEHTLIQVLRLGNHEALAPVSLRIELGTVERTQIKRSVRVKQE